MKASALLLSGCLLLVLCAAMLAAVERPDRFPHDTHIGLFPVCEGCHAGIATDNAKTAFPSQQDCANCHDGTRLERVQWEHAKRANSLDFSHVAHQEATEESAGQPRCQSCHATGPGRAAMEVGAAQPENCMQCHAEKTETHLAATMLCRRCHRPVARAVDLQTADIARFPRPEWHQDAGFESTHGKGDATRAATCAVCHARESCLRCHANAARVPQIAALAPDTRIATLQAGKRPVYPLPASHTTGAWKLEHGGYARAGIASCSNCHVQPDCAQCHQGGANTRATIAALPAIAPRGRTATRVPKLTSRVHPADVVRTHRSMAATNRSECAQCHTAAQCASCHAGSDSRRLHTANYTERHAADVFAGSSRCQSCHNTEQFCRGCHENSGVAASNRMDAAFHDAQPLWILTHGQAARTGMEACAACHRQNDCVRCHSAATGWGVNPHRAGYDAARIAKRNAAGCRLCHTGNPLKDD